MSIESRKLLLIEEILNIENELVLEELDSVISRNRSQMANRISLKNFEGIWTEEEAEEMKRNIEEGCGRKNTLDRK